MCERCWGKAFSAAYGIGSKTQAREYERIVASCACTPWQRLGVADSFAEGYAARDKEIEELRAKLASMREPLWMLREEHEREIEELRTEVNDWRESARKASGERCEDEIHCPCVPYLRVEIETLRARVKAMEVMVPKLVTNKEFEKYAGRWWLVATFGHYGDLLLIVPMSQPIPLLKEGR